MAKIHAFPSFKDLISGSYFEGKNCEVSTYPSHDGKIFLTIDFKGKTRCGISLDPFEAKQLRNALNNELEELISRIKG